jgi:alkyl sulfatase BDS1-like metallo-beta-lactamase superfamily hydrolase
MFIPAANAADAPKPLTDATKAADAAVMDELLSYLDNFDFWFDIVTP